MWRRVIWWIRTEIFEKEPVASVYKAQDLEASKNGTEEGNRESDFKETTRKYIYKELKF